MRDIDVTLKIKNIVLKDKVVQYFFISSYMDYFLDETYSFYRHLNDFIERFYLDLEVLSVSRGKNQFIISYKKNDTFDYDSLKDIDTIVTTSFTPREEWCCQNCIFEESGSCYSEGVKTTLHKDNCCSNWTEKD